MIQPLATLLTNIPFVLIGRQSPQRSRFLSTNSMSQHFQPPPSPDAFPFYVYRFPGTLLLIRLREFPQWSIAETRVSSQSLQRLNGFSRSSFSVCAIAAAFSFFLLYVLYPALRNRQRGAATALPIPDREWCRFVLPSLPSISCFVFCCYIF